MEYLPAKEIRDVFEAVSRKHADYGIVPIVNSTEGAVTQTSNMFIESSLNICSEIYLEIHQNLLANCDFKDIHTVISHPQPLAQCRNWISANLSGVKILESVSTAKAAAEAAAQDGVAAIASEAAAAIYDLRVIEEKLKTDLIMLQDLLSWRMNLVSLQVAIRQVFYSALHMKLAVWLIIC